MTSARDEQPNAAFNDRLHEEGRTLLRIAEELRGFLSDAPFEDPDVKALLRDCKVLDSVGRWLSGVTAVTFPKGVSVK